MYFVGARVVIYEYWTNPTTTVVTVFESHALCLPLNARFFSIFNSRYLSIATSTETLYNIIRSEDDIK
jgi:hypothetical protein